MATAATAPGAVPQVADPPASLPLAGLPPAGRERSAPVRAGGGPLRTGGGRAFAVRLVVSGLILLAGAGPHLLFGSTLLHLAVAMVLAGACVLLYLRAAKSHPCYAGHGRVAAAALATLVVPIALDAALVELDFFGFSALPTHFIALALFAGGMMRAAHPGAAEPFDHGDLPRGIVSHSDRASGPGGAAGGAAGSSRRIGNTSVLQFRVTVPKGPPISVMLAVEGTDALVIDGDDVTLLPRSGRSVSERFRDITVVNHTARQVLSHRRLSVLRWLAWVLLFPALSAAVFLAAPPTGPDGRSMALFAAFLAVGGLFVLCWPRTWREGSRALQSVRYARGIRGTIAALTSGWPSAVYRDPVGVIEGILTFPRGKPNPRKDPADSIRDWSLFRIAIRNVEGEVVDRLTWGSLTQNLPGQLRRGDTVRVLGNWQTGAPSRAGKNAVELV